MTVDPAKSREQRLFEAALRLAPGRERQAFVEAVCANDNDLRGRLEQLLAAASEAEAFFEKDPLEQAGIVETPFLPTVKVAPVTQTAGQSIGRYKLLQQIGEGGLGVVFMAEQEEPVRRRVALKIIKPGMDTQSVIARFEAERQALALMDHPNIAKILDGGVTEDARPYFVMDLIQGLPVTQFCDEASLPAARRLELFVEICGAVQHAHQKGIIHRDIKPSNILVTLDGDKPVPKIIDFGIAKATQQRLTDKTLFTQFQQFIGTPAYMSPEQASLTGLDIDTRSDIYSLGVLLYELLTGKTPFDARELLKAGLDEMRRTIREKEPERPSTKVGTLTREELTTTAKRRGLDAPKLVSALRGDLDWIVMKCLEKDRVRRYETASGLGMDIQRHLSNEPVVACPPSSFYRFRKMVRRNKLAVAAGTAVVVFFLMGLGGATWGFFREREARRTVEALRAKEQVRLQKAEVVAKIYKAKELYHFRKREEAERLLNEIPPSAIEPDSEHANVRRMLAWWYAIHEEWSKSAANCAVLDQVDGSEIDSMAIIPWDRRLHGIVLVQQGDLSGYEAFRQRTLTNFVPQGPGGAAEVCRLQLLLPAGQTVVQKMDKFYEIIERARNEPGANPNRKAHADLSLGLVDYRRGDFQKAVTNCLACLNTPVNAFPAYLYFPAAQALLAMSYHQLHRDKEAFEALAVARKDDYSDLVKLIQDETPYPLFDALYGHILLSEAEALIEGHPREDSRYYATGEACLGANYARGEMEGGKPNLDEAVRWYRLALQHGSPEAAVQLAWTLATCRDPKIRDGTNAVQLAETAARASEGKDLDVLDTLAAAYAEIGQFEMAVATEKEALAINTDSGVARIMQTRLKLYESHKPFRE